MCLYSQSPQVCKSVCRVLTSLTTALVGVECTTHHPGSGGVADVVSVTMPLLSIKHLAVAIFHQRGTSRFFVRESVELFIEHSGR